MIGDDLSPLLIALICGGSFHLRDLAEVADPLHPAMRTLRHHFVITPEGNLVCAPNAVQL